MCIILAVNAGSSSLKITIYRKIKQASGEHDHSASCVSLEPGTPELVSTATISDIATTNPSFMLNGKSLPTYGITDHGTAFARFLSELNCSHDSSSEQPQRNRIRYVCHRIVHGGPQPPAPVASDDRGILLDRSSESYHRLTAPAMSDLAPLHNRAALSVVEACFEQLPQAKSAAYFDTSFHRSIPPHVAAYPVDPSFARQRGLTKYGFHGLSYAFIVRTVSRFLGRPTEETNLIALHLGSGASVCAIRGGRSLDTSMGLTPLSGLPGATRSGSVDPSLVFHLAGGEAHDVRLTITEAEDILNRKSGWKALVGTTDFRVVTERAMSTDSANSSESEEVKVSKLAFDMFVDRVLGYVGSYHVKLDGQVDAVVFAGGIGERSAELRKAVAGRLSASLGYAEVDEKKNERLGEGVVLDIGVKREEMKRGRILVCRTDEQLEMARACALNEEFWTDN